MSIASYFDGTAFRPQQQLLVRNESTFLPTNVEKSSLHCAETDVITKVEFAYMMHIQST